MRLGSRARLRAVVAIGAVALLAAGCVPVEPAPVDTGPPSGSAAYTAPGVTTFVVPFAICAITITADGGHGGAGFETATAAPGSAGGAGARVSTHFAVPPGTTLVAMVGGAGADATATAAGRGGVAGGGGGGGGGVIAPPAPAVADNTGGGGAGASLVVVYGGIAPIVVAGGGGGGGGGSAGTGTAGGTGGPIGAPGGAGGVGATGGSAAGTGGTGGVNAGGGGGTAVGGSGVPGMPSGGAGTGGNALNGGGGGGGGGVTVANPGGALGGPGTGAGATGTGGAGGAGMAGGGTGGLATGDGGAGGTGGFGFGGGGGGAEKGAGGGGAGWGAGGGGPANVGGGGGSSVVGSGTAFTSSAPSLRSGDGQVVVSWDGVGDACPVTAPVGHVPLHTNAGPPTRPLVAISIDDLWGAAGARDVNATMDVLASRSVKGVTFFPTGGAIEQHNALGYAWVWRRVARSGSEIGNHTYTHSQLPGLSDLGIWWEMQHTQDLLNVTLGRGFAYQMHLMRPPGGAGGYGSGDPRILNVVNSMGLSMVMWGIETHGSGPTHGAFVSSIIRNARPGSIVLLHFTQITPSEIGTLIDGLRGRGLEPTTVTSLFP